MKKLLLPLFLTLPLYASEDEAPIPKVPRESEAHELQTALDIVKRYKSRNPSNYHLRAADRAIKKAIMMIRSREEARAQKR